MAETPKKTDVETRTDTKPAETRAARDLAPAGQSGDPAVQKLLAERDGHLINIQPADPEVARRREAAEKAIAEIDRKLADLGYKAG